jgi:uncharacterized membrane protein HdeD (DUF308 family)
MGRSRRARRKAERARARRSPRVQRHLSAAKRAAILTLGLVVIVAGLFMVGHLSVETSNRLGRVGGIMIVLGIFVVLAAIFNWF